MLTLAISIFCVVYTHATADPTQLPTASPIVPQPTQSPEVPTKQPTADAFRESVIFIFDMRNAFQQDKTKEEGGGDFGGPGHATNQLNKNKRLYCGKDAKEETATWTEDKNGKFAVTRKDFDDSAQGDAQYIDTNKNVWFAWDTTPDVKSIEIDITGWEQSEKEADNTNKWAYFVYDADHDAHEGLLTISSLVEICYECGQSANKQIDIDLSDEDFNRGRYWIGVDGKGQIKLTCYKDYFEPPDDTEIALIASGITVFTLFLLCCLLMGVWSNRKWHVFNPDTGKFDKEEPVPLCCGKKSDEIRSQSEKGTELNTLNPKTSTTDNVEQVDSQEEKEVSTAALQEQISGMKKDISELKKEEKVYPDTRGSDPFYGQYLEIMSNTAENEEGLDVYQILAFRLKFNAKKPPYACRFSDVQIAIFVAAVTSFLQTYGVSLTLYSVIITYFYDDEDGSIHEDAQCEWQKEVWRTDGQYKLLAFLWSVVISLSVAIYATGTLKNGLNSLIEKAHPWEELMKINQLANVTALQYGIIVNYYTLTMAILGSFFLIYASEGGADALDMILNAVALYFMIELDDMLVQTKAYTDLKEHTKWLKRTKGEEAECCGCDCCKCMGACQCKVLFFKCGNGYRYFTMVIIALASFTMPIVILACW